MTDRESLMRRIRKLLALAADNPDSPESQAAAEKAGKLMSEYQVEFASIEMEEDEIIEDAAKMYMSEDGKWSHSLITVIGHTFNCKVIRTMDKKSFIIIGYKHDVELTKWMFSYLRMIISRKADKLCSGVRERTNFGMGFVSAVNLRFREIYSATKQNLDKNTTAIVVQKDHKVEEKYRSMFPHARNTRSTFTRDKNFYKGNEIGNSIPLSRPVNGNGSGQVSLH